MERHPRQRPLSDVVDAVAVAIAEAVVDAVAVGIDPAEAVAVGQAGDGH